MSLSEKSERNAAFNDESRRWKERQKQQIREKFQAQNDFGACLSETAPPDTALARFVLSSAFNNACTFVVLANTVLTGLETDWAMGSAMRNEPLPAFFVSINRGFTCIFCLELAMRICSLRMHWITCADWRWNVFDFLLAGTAISEELLESMNLSFLRILRILRVARAARIMRVLRLFRQLRRMVLSISACLASLFWAFLLLFIINFVFALVFMQGATEYLTERGASAADDTGLGEWYGTVTTTMFSLLLATSGGRDWWDIAIPIVNISLAYQYLFAFYVLFVVVGVLNVLTAVFVENATEFHDKDLVAQSQMMKEDQFHKEMLTFFQECEKEGDGILTYEEFQACLEKDEVSAYLKGHDIGKGDAHTLFKLLAEDDADHIDAESFIHGCLRLKGPSKAIDLANLMHQVQPPPSLGDPRASPVAQDLACVRRTVPI